MNCLCYSFSHIFPAYQKFSNISGCIRLHENGYNDRTTCVLRVFNKNSNFVYKLFIYLFVCFLFLRLTSLQRHSNNKSISDCVCVCARAHVMYGVHYYYFFFLFLLCFFVILKWIAPNRYRNKSFGVFFFCSFFSPPSHTYALIRLLEPWNCDWTHTQMN